jgi:hypothetical protein
MARRYRRRADFDSPFWWAAALVMLAFWLVVAGLWLVWAFIALPVAAIASIRHKDYLADRMINSLKWKAPGSQAQKRAAGKAQAERQRWRTIVSLSGIVTARTPGQAQVRIVNRDSYDGPLHIGQTVTVPCKDPAVTEGQGVHLRYRLGDWKLRGLTVDPAIAAQEAERLAAKADHDARTHRYRVSKCRIDALKGGEFTLEAEDADPVHIALTPEAAMHFLSLKNGDIAQVTLGPGNSGLEEFWQLSRANGARPRSPVELSRRDMEWLGMTGTST